MSWLHFWLIYAAVPLCGKSNINRYGKQEAQDWASIHLQTCQLHRLKTLWSLLSKKKNKTTRYRLFCRQDGIYRSWPGFVSIAQRGLSSWRGLIFPGERSEPARRMLVVPGNFLTILKYFNCGDLRFLNPKHLKGDTSGTWQVSFGTLHRPGT